MDKTHILYELLTQELKKCGGNETKLAKQLGIPRQLVHKWFAGTCSPSLEHTINIIKLYGGDLSRALPGITDPSNIELVNVRQEADYLATALERVTQAARQNLDQIETIQKSVARLRTRGK